MRNLIFLSAALGMLVTGACSQEEELRSTEPSVETKSAMFRTPEQAVQIAKDVLACDIPTSRSARSPQSVASVKTLRGASSRGEDNNPLVYVVPCENDEGFVLVGAPVGAPEVLAVIDEGIFDSEETRKNEGFQAALQNILDFVSPQISLPPNPDPILPIDPIPFNPGKYDTTDYVNVKTQNLVKVKWNQGWPEGIYASNLIAGCVPVALGQVLSVYEQPTTIQYTYPGRDRLTDPINWTEIKKHTKSCCPGAYNVPNNPHYNHCAASSDAHLTLARIIRQMGQLVDADYSDPFATGSNYKKIPSVINKFLPSKTVTTTSDHSTLFEALKTGNAVAFMNMYESEPSGEHSSHTWVADGAWHYRLRVVYSGPEIRALKPGEKPEPFVTFVYTDINEQYVHYNWGHGGNCNGYFGKGAVNTQKPYIYDDPTGDNNISYYYDKVLAFYIVK